MEEVIQKIHQINEKLSDEGLLKSLNGDQLSYIAVKVAALKGYLIEEKALAQERMLYLEVEKDKVKGEAYLRAKEAHNATAASDAKYTDEEFVKAQHEYVEARAAFERLRMVSTDAHDLIDAIKSRVIDLQGARRDERLS